MGDLALVFDRCMEPDAAELPDRRLFFSRALFAHIGASHQLVAALAAAVAGSFVATLRWWFATDVRCGADEIDTFFQTLIQPGIAAVLATLPPSASAT